MDVSGHAAIVTGGASGLGAATAKALADAAGKVAVLDLNADAAAQSAAWRWLVTCATRLAWKTQWRRRAKRMARRAS